MTKPLLTASSIVAVCISFCLNLSVHRGWVSHHRIGEFTRKGVPADDWFERQRAFPFDEIPNEEYLRAIEYVRTHMTVGDLAGSNAWALAGPTNVEGRITTIAIHPSNPQIVYTGTANGGVWKSSNFCQTWTSVFDNQNTSSIGALAIDPMNSSTIYCGTGEANSLRSYYPGTGVYKSTDAGSTWALVGLSQSYSIGNIAINPSNPQEMYAAAVGSLRRKNDERGIYKSTNGGGNWSRVLFIADSVGAIDVVIDPTNPAKVFAAMWERMRREDFIKYGGPMTALHVSTNAGASWSVVNGGFPSNDPTLGRIALSISRSNPQIVYALTAFASGGSRGLYKSTNGGVTWSLVNSSVAGSSNYAWFNRTIAVSPINPGAVFCGGLNMEYSVNGGISFASVGASHVDQHAVAFAPSNSSYIVVGNDGGIDRSTDGGGSWGASGSLPITQFYAGCIDQNNPAVILGGTQDNGTVRTATGALGNWENIYGGDGFYCLVDYTTSQRVYASSQYGGLGRSVNGGASFQSGTSGLDLAYTNWMTPYVMNKTNPLTLYCGTYKIHKSVDGMQSWIPISPDLTSGHVQLLGSITTVDVAKSDTNIIYCGTDDANVWVTTNGGGTWTNINAGLPYRWVTRVAVDPDSANICLVTLSGYKIDTTGAHIYRTTNHGVTWLSIKGNLPDAPINDVVIDPANTRTLYIATDVGVMYSTDLGVNWNVLGSGFPSNVPCHDLTLHSPTRTLMAWTHGRSAFRIILPPPTGVSERNTPPRGTFRLEQNYPNPFNPATTVRFALQVAARVTLKVYDLLGKEVITLVDEQKPAGNSSVDWNGRNESGDEVASGLYLCRIHVGDVSATRKMFLLR